VSVPHGQRQGQKRGHPALHLLRFHIGAEDGVDAGLIAALLAKPAEQVGVEAHGHDGFWGGHYDLGVFPEGGIGRVSVGVPLDALAYLGVGRAAQLVPVRSNPAISFFSRSLSLRGFANSSVSRAARSARPR
jgi:hypothetical protein